jgi:hypothetical protein
MKSRRIAVLLLIASSATFLPGCRSRVRVERQYDLEPGDIRYIMVDPPSQEQNVTVAVKSGGVPIDVFVVEGKSDSDADKAVGAGKGIIASKTDATDPSLDAKVPAGKAFVVMLRTGKSAKVQVNVASR